MKVLTLLVLVFVSACVQAKNEECPRGDSGECLDGDYPNTRDCSTFYKCSNCIPFLVKCPDGLDFSPDKLKCLYPDEAGCEYTTRSVLPPKITKQRSTLGWILTSTKRSITKSTINQSKKQPYSTNKRFSRKSTKEIKFVTSRLTSNKLPDITYTKTPRSPVKVSTGSANTSPSENIVKSSPHQLTTATPYIPESLQVLYCGVNRDRIESSNPIPMNAVRLNIGNHYDVITHTFFSFDGGVYFSSINAGVPSSGDVTIELRDVSQGSVISRLLRRGIERERRDTIGRSELVRVGTRSKLQLSSDNELFSDPELLHTSWTLFSLDAHSSTVYFSALRPGQSSGTGRVRFPSVKLNKGGAFRATNSEFVAPYSGRYLFNLAAGVDEGTMARLQLTISEPFGKRNSSVGNDNGRRVDKRPVELWLDETDAVTIDGFEVASKTVLLDLVAGDRVWVSLVKGQLGDAGDFDHSFAGFLYSRNPLDGSSWSSHKTTSAISLLPQDPITFEVRTVDDGGSFNLRYGTFACQTPGLYYISISVSLAPDFPLEVSLYRNARHEVAELVRRSRNHRNGHTERALIIKLERYDRLQLIADSGSVMYSDQNLQTSFSGFLIRA